MQLCDTLILPLALVTKKSFEFQLPFFFFSLRTNLHKVRFGKTVSRVSICLLLMTSPESYGGFLMNLSEEKQRSAPVTFLNASPPEYYIRRRKCRERQILELKSKDRKREEKKTSVHA